MKDKIVFTLKMASILLGFCALLMGGEPATKDVMETFFWTLAACYGCFVSAFFIEHSQGK